MSALSSRHKDVAGRRIIGCGLERVLLVEDFVGVLLDGPEAAGDIFVEDANDGVLSQILGLTGLRVGVRDVGVKSVVLEPGVRGVEILIRKGVERIQAAEVIEGMSCLVNEDSYSAIDLAEQNDIAVGVVRPTTGRVWQRNQMAY